MTIKMQYNEMKSELRRYNKKDSTENYIYKIEHHSKKAKKMLIDLLNADFEYIQNRAKRGDFTVDAYNLAMKVWNECSTSIAKMNIF